MKAYKNGNKVGIENMRFLMNKTDKDDDMLIF